MLWITEVLAAGEAGNPMDVASAGQRLITEGGVLGTLLFLALAAISVLYIDARFRNKEDRNTIKEMEKAHNDERDAWAKQLHDINNERFKEMREVLVAMNNSTAALQVISQTNGDRSTTMAEITKAVAELVTLNKVIKESLDRNHNRMGNLEGLIKSVKGSSSGGTL